MSYGCLVPLNWEPEFSGPKQLTKRNGLKHKGQSRLSLQNHHPFTLNDLYKLNEMVEKSG